MDNQNLQADTKNSKENLSKVFICHRSPERTFKIGNHYFPVCSRCTGIYIGAFSYYTFVYFSYVQYDITMILAAILMILPTFSDGLTQFFGFRESNNALRFATGVIAGIGLGILVKSVKWFLIS
jgi:Predicted membrane protein